MADLNRYAQIIEKIFFSHYSKGDEEFVFDRSEIVEAARELGIALPKNLGDIIYSFRYRVPLPKSVTKTLPAGTQWIIRPAGKSKYCFVAAKVSAITPGKMIAETKIPDATPGVIAMYALSDEQALLAKLRYNRLIDIFTGVACYSLQSHLRTSIPLVGQVETDEIYIGLDRRGAHFVFPVQAKGGRDALNIVQIEQDFALCAHKFRALICRPIAAQFMAGDVIALFEFEEGDAGIAITSEKHYRLVPPEEMDPDELLAYRQRPM